MVKLYWLDVAACAAGPTAAKLKPAEIMASAEAQDLKLLKRYIYSPTQNVYSVGRRRNNADPDK